MEVIYTLIPGMILFGLIVVVMLIWAVRRGQYDDPEGEASRILHDDDTPPKDPRQGMPDYDGDD